jgi:hypothetical protein
VEYSVKLPQLSSRVVFPERLCERIRHDAACGELIYRGFMTKCTYDELAALDSDPDYRRALEQLFVLTSQEVARPAAKAKSYAAGLVLAIAATLLVAAGAAWSLAQRSAPKTADSVATTTVSAVK